MQYIHRLSLLFSTGVSFIGVDSNRIHGQSFSLFLHFIQPADGSMHYHYLQHQFSGKLSRVWPRCNLRFIYLHCTSLVWMCFARGFNLFHSDLVLLNMIYWILYLSLFYCFHGHITLLFFLFFDHLTAVFVFMFILLVLYFFGGKSCFPYILFLCTIYFI